MERSFLLLVWRKGKRRTKPPSFFIQSFLELDRLTRKINNETKARGEIKKKRVHPIYSRDIPVTPDTLRKFSGPKVSRL